MIIMHSRKEGAEMQQIKLIAQRLPKPNAFNWEYSVFTTDGNRLKESWGRYDFRSNELIRVQPYGVYGVDRLSASMIDEWRD